MKAKRVLDFSIPFGIVFLIFFILAKSEFRLIGEVESRLGENLAILLCSFRIFDLVSIAFLIFAVIVCIAAMLRVEERKI